MVAADLGRTTLNIQMPKEGDKDRDGQVKVEIAKDEDVEDEADRNSPDENGDMPMAATDIIEQRGATATATNATTKDAKRARKRAEHCWSRRCEQPSPLCEM